METAQSLFELGYGNQGSFSISEPFYKSSGFKDELAWAAVWCVICLGDGRIVVSIVRRLIDCLVD